MAKFRIGSAGSPRKKRVKPKRKTLKSLDSASKTCQICLCKVPKSSLVQVTPECTHAKAICKACMEKTLGAEINGKGVEEGIRCPHRDSNCVKILSIHDVKRLATHRLFERYDQLLRNKALSNDLNFRWCKRSGCGSGQIHDGDEDTPIMTCHACSARSCFPHDVPYHEGMSCIQYDGLKERSDDTATADFLARRTKQCPKCTRHIEKNGGCNHMTCQRPAGCGHEFCWLCLADYKKILKHGNHRHSSTCKLFSDYHG